MLADPWAPVTPAFLHMPPWEVTYGPEVADFCALLGYAPDPEQAVWLDAVFGVAADGLPACEEATDVAGRQNLKTGELAMTALGWLFLTREDRVLWSAHEFGTTRDAFLLLRRLLEGKAWANKLVRQYYGSATYMAIVTTDGRAVEFTARTTSQGRGKSAPKAIWDEGLELKPEHLGAQDAVKSTYPWAQTLIGSSACKDYSEVLRAKVDKLRAGQLGPREFGREFTDDLPGECDAGEDCSHRYGLVSGCRLDDRDRWKRANPALGRIRGDGRGLTVQALERERRNQPLPMIFARERLGWHDILRADLLALHPFTRDELVVDADSQIVGEPVFALDVAPDAVWASIVAAGHREDGRLHVEIPSTPVEVPSGGRAFAHQVGDSWVKPWFASRLDAADDSTPTYDAMRVLVLAGSEAASLVPALRKLAGLDVVVVPEVDYPAACGTVTRLVKGEQLVFVGEGPLVDAALAVIRKPSKERATGWSRERSDDDISSWVAATLLAAYFEGVAEGGFNVW